MKHAKNIFSKTPAFLMTTVMTISLLPPVPAFAAASNTPKEEVIYINLNTDGSVKEINVVNSFELPTDGQIVDFGRYQSLRNMTTTDPIDYTDETVTIDAKAGKLYYEGKLDGNLIPWNLQIRYYMDGTEYPAEELAGMSGALKIQIEVTENTDCRGNFFDDYALQASLTLDTNQCKNITAENATVANVGNDKQITYTILPGKGIDTEITADVTDFTMDGISINGIPLNLDIEVDDSELMDQVTDLLDAIGELDDGAGELKDGVSELQNGAQDNLQNGVSALQNGASDLQNGVGALQTGGATLQSGAAELQNGAAALDEGIRSLHQGIGTIQTALDTLNGQSSALRDGSASFKDALSQLQSALSGLSLTEDNLSDLANASTQIKDGIDQIVNGASSLQAGVSFEAYKAVMSQNGLDIDDLKQKNTAAIEAIQSMAASLTESLSALQASGIDTTDLSKQAEQIQNIAALLGANNAAIDGTGTYLGAVNQNLGTLLEGAATLQTNYASFDSAIQTLVDTLGGLTYQMSELSSAVDTLVSEYEKLDNGILSYTDGVAQIVAGYSQLSDGAAQLVAGSGALKTGTDSLYSGTGELLSGISEIYNGTGSLKDGTGALDEGVAKLLTGIAQLYDGTGELKDGTSAMREETSGMDTKINDKIDDLLETITGGDMEIESFVSDKNTNVESVQFVIQTDGISTAEQETPAPSAKAERTIWQKFLDLFR